MSLIFGNGTSTGWGGLGAQTPYGYGQAPGQSGLGYYEQQTPMGSFAASEWSGPVNQQYGQAYTAQNGYIGQTTPGIGGQASVMPWAQQAAQVGQQANPWLGQSTQQAAQVGPNAFGGSNPWLGQQIQQAQDETSKAWSNSVRPALDSAMRASGSFGNTAIQEQQNNAYSDLGKQLGGIASGMRMQDYTQQQQLSENALNRQQQVNLANSGLSAQDLSRNLGGFFQGQGLGMQGLGQAQGAAQFDATMDNTINTTNAGLASGDLTRNANLMQGLGQFNATQLGGMSQFNAGQGNALGQFSAGQRQANNQANSGAANSMLGQQRQLGQQQNQFDQNMDFTTWQANNNNMRQGTQDQINLLNSLLGWQGLGTQAGTQIQNTPLNYWQQFSQGAGALGGVGGTTTGTTNGTTTGQNANSLQGNPLLGALGGAQVGSQFWNFGKQQGWW